MKTEGKKKQIIYQMTLQVKYSHTFGCSVLALNVVDFSIMIDSFFFGDSYLHSSLKHFLGDCK